MWSDAKRWDAADKAYHDVMKAAAGSGPAIRAQLFQSWGDTYRARSDWSNAEACYLHSLAEIQKLDPEDLAIARAFSDLGYISRQRGDLEGAEKYFRQALEIQQKRAPGSLDLAATLGNLGLVALSREDLAKAEEYHSQALEIRQKLAPGSVDVARSVNNLGTVALLRGDLAKAEELYRGALDIEEKLAPDSTTVATSYNNLGLVAYDRGDLARAEEYFHRAVELREKLAPGSLALAEVLTNLSNVTGDRGDVAKTEECLRRALEIEQRLAPGSTDVAASYSNLGILIHDRGDLAKAEQLFRQAVEIYQKQAPGSLSLATALVNLGAVADDRGDWVKADQFYRRALALQEKQAPDSQSAVSGLTDIGHRARRRGNVAKAEEYFRRALALQQKTRSEDMRTATIYNDLADMAQDQNQLAKAGEYYQRALAILRRLAPESKEYAETLASLASVKRRKGQTDSAAQLFEQALNAFESQIAHLGGAEETRVNFRASHANYLNHYIDLLTLENKPDVAFHVAERWRARSLVEMLAGARIDIRRGVDSDLRDRERLLQESLRAKSDRRIKLLSAEHIDAKQVAEVEREIADLHEQQDALEGRIRATSPVYAALTHPHPLTVSEAQQLLDDETVLLEYSLGEERSYVWAITRDSLHGYALPPASKVETLARRLYRLISSPGALQATGEAGPKTAERFRTAAAALSGMLIAPVAAEITGKRLLIVPDGALQYVPFAVLPVPRGPRDVPLIVEHEIVYAPSASVLAELRREAGTRTRAPKAVAVFADPVFSLEDPRVPASGRALRETASHKAGPLADERLTRSVADVGLAHLSRLPFSGREAKAIMAVTPAGQGKEAVGFDADRATATAHELTLYRIVHFATHALSDNRHPELSGLVLSLVDRKGKFQDGFLDLQSIYNLHLPAELVVLSACKTGLGKEVAGEGLMGLTRAFMYAGATRVVASLWNVNDVSTKELMEKFYRAMEQEGMPPAAALRTAQLALWKDSRWHDAYHWAAFQIQGEWK
jgi:CHAT domain-containing protein/Tfp pilus assembly protein PilF